METAQMDEKAIVIYYDNGDKSIFRNCFNESGIRCHSWLKNNLAFQIFVISQSKKKIKRLFHNHIYYYPKNFDGLIILFDTKVPEHYYRALREKNPQARIIIWYWNEIGKGNWPRHSDEFETWSYSPADCEKFGLIYNQQFFFDSIVKRYSYIRDQREMTGDRSFIFMGREKGRSDHLQTIADEIKKCGWGCETEYLSTCKSDRPQSKDVKYISGFRYDEYIEKVVKYQGILDAAYRDNSGLSLRTMESIFFHKKLITTNHLVESYDFYDENNIYIWGKSQISLEEFLSRPYRPVPDSVCKPYLITSWLARIKEHYGIE